MEGTKADECPNCRQPLEVRPKRKSKCPHCGKFILVRKPYLMTERESELSYWADRLEGLEVLRSEIDTHAADLKKQFGFEPAVNDVIWRALNSVVSNRPGSFEARRAYGEMAHIALSEGKDPRAYERQEAKLELLRIKQEGYAKSVKVMTVNDASVCKACRALERRTIPLEEALKTLPVPNVCENEDGCRCWYSEVSEFDFDL